MNYSRRDMLRITAGALTIGVTGAGSSILGADKKKKKIPIGLQLYSVRKECEKDLPMVLEAVAKMGYDGVEFAGYYGRNAKEMRKLLDDNGLVCCGTHAQFASLQDDQFEATVEFNKILGNKYLIVPALPHARLADEAAVKETARWFNQAARKARPHGMRVGYHAHGGDFRKLGETTPWEILFGNTARGVVMQLDIGNCLGGGGDPYAMLEKFPGRSATIHLKEHGGPRGAAVGDGDVDWDRVFELCETTGKTKWYVVEHEVPGRPALESVAQCINNLRKMGK